MTWKTTMIMKSTLLILILALLPTLPRSKTLSNKETKTLPFLKSNKSFFKLPTHGEQVSGRNKRDSLEFIGTVEEYSSAEKDDILQRHLDLRSGVTPEASNMEYMYWDDNLATMGEQWSSACLLEHGQPDNISPYSSLGQNLWLGSGSLGSPPDPVPAVQAWYNEDQYYDYDSHSCSKVCGHYTQVVWADTIYVGCGRAFCESVSDGKYTNAWIVTCNYAPAGNYVGTRPYLSGSSCTQCASGVGTCYSNQCRNCTQDGVSCDCNTVCNNCGTKTAACTCECQSGWYGSDCNTECVDTHGYCWQNPGWPGPQYCDFHPAVPIGCPLMCSVCEAATGDEVCNEQPSTASSGVTNGNSVTVGEQPSTASSGVTDGNSVTDRGGMSNTNSATTQGDIEAVITTKVATDAPICGGMSQECLNGGTFKQSSCTCKCRDEYQGDQCQNSKEEARYGVLILFIDSIHNYDSYVDLLLSLVAQFITGYCNDNVDTCCGVPGKATPPRRYDFVSTENVVTAMGYPYNHDTRNDAYWTMLAVTVPTQTDLCINGTEDSNRKRRDTEPVMLRYRRTTDSSSYLPQDVLMDVVEDNLDNITATLDVTVDGVERGEVEDSNNASSGGLAAWAIVLIVIFIIVIIIVIVVVVILLLKGPKPHKNQVTYGEETSSRRDSGNNNTAEMNSRKPQKEREK